VRDPHAASDALCSPVMGVTGCRPHSPGRHSISWSIKRTPPRVPGDVIEKSLRASVASRHGLYVAGSTLRTRWLRPKIRRTSMPDSCWPTCCWVSAVRRRRRRCDATPWLGTRRRL